MTELLKLPVGIENFEEIRRDGFYFVDKKKLIEQLLSHWGKETVVKGIASLPLGGFVL